MPKIPDGYHRNVFINCPFDDDYQPIFKALVFATFVCGLQPRCALEVYDAGEVRFEKIARIIGECRWGIHDISRIELSSNGFPRFNMPFELGIFLGARRFGGQPQKQKSCLILDTDRYRYQQFISDIAGQDIDAHQGNAAHAMKAVRNWMAASGANIPGARAMSNWFQAFLDDLPAICAKTKRDATDLMFTEFADAASTWLTTELARVEAQRR